MQYVNHFLALPADLHSELCEYARQRGITLSDILIESILATAEEHRWRATRTKVSPVTLNEPAKLLRA